MIEYFSSYHVDIRNNGQKHVPTIKRLGLPLKKLLRLWRSIEKFLEYLTVNSKFYILN